MASVLYRRKRDTKVWTVSPLADYADLLRQGYQYRFFTSETAAEAASADPFEVMSLSEFTKFVTDYYKAGYGKTYRLGQAFMNECMPKNYIDSEVFYQEKTQVAENLIRERYIGK